MKDNDLYNETFEKFVDDVMMELVEQKKLGMMILSNGKNSIGRYIINEMTISFPELIEVLLQFNPYLTVDFVIDEINSIIKGYGIDW